MKIIRLCSNLKASMQVWDQFCSLRHLKLMGHLDSMMYLNLGPWVCDCCINEPGPYLNDYRKGYTHHPPEIEEPYEGKRHIPIPGKLYRFIKFAKGANGIRYVEHVYDAIYVSAYTDEELLRMNNIWRIKGYYGTREFYQPDEVDMLSSIPDVRNTLLWAPEVVTDANGEAVVSFYCSDINTGFTGRIEGIGGDGLLGTAKFDFRVTRSLNPLNN